MVVSYQGQLTLTRQEEQELAVAYGSERVAQALESVHETSWTMALERQNLNRDQEMKLLLRSLNR